MLATTRLVSFKSQRDRGNLKGPFLPVIWRMSGCVGWQGVAQLVGCLVHAVKKEDH